VNISPRPDWAHPHSDTHAAKYLAAVKYLRKKGKWVLDQKVPKKELQ
jgi:hypothetical protein